MPTDLDLLEAEVLHLTPSDRGRLLDGLIASLEQDAEVEAEWDAEAQRREAELDSEPERASPFEQVIACLEARFPR